MTENEIKRLERLREKMVQMKAQEQKIIARDNERKRKERTRRLFQYGEMVEKHFKGIEPIAFEKLLHDIKGKLNDR